MGVEQVVSGLRGVVVTALVVFFVIRDSHRELASSDAIEKLPVTFCVLATSPNCPKPFFFK
jgi:hypothetical protein